MIEVLEAEKNQGREMGFDLRKRGQMPLCLFSVFSVIGTSKQRIGVDTGTCLCGSLSPIGS